MPTLNINNDDIRLNSSSSDKVVVTGNLGVGTTSPAYKLDVSGDIRSTNIDLATQGVNVSSYGFLSQTLSGQMTFLGHNVRASNTVNNTALVVNGGWISSLIKQYYNEGITFHTSTTEYAAGATYPLADTERMRITSAGNVGIGTTSPGRKLTVQGADDGTMQLRLMGTASQTSYWEIGREAQSTGQFRFIASRNGTVITPMVIDDQTGNVGIGTTAPASKLDVISSSTQIADFRSTVTDGLSNIRVVNDQQTTASGTSPAAIELVGKRGSSTHGRHAWIGAEGVDGTTFRTQIKFKVRPEDSPYQWSTLPTQMVIDGNGNVGIGTSGPGYKLDVVAGANSTYPFIVRNAGNVEIGGIYSTSGGAGQIYLFNASTVTTVKISTIDSSYFNGGNVGIGTTSPFSRFTVSGALSASTSQISIVNTEGGHSIIRSGISGVSNNGMSFVTASVDGSGQTIPMVINASGNVGIGTTIPGSRLQVTATSNSATTVDNGITILNDSGINNCLAGIRLSTYGDSDGGLYPKQFIGAIRDGAFGAGKGSIVFCNRDAADTSVVALSDEKMRILPNGNVGIGTAAPSSKLHIDSALGADVISISDNAGSVRLTLGQESSYTGNYIDSKNIDLKLKSALAGGSGGNIFFQTGTSAASTQVTINVSGNVGIGTTSPTRRLHIVSSDDTRGIMVEQTSASSYAEVHFKANREYRIGTGGSTSAAEAANNWYVYDATAALQRFVITSAGNVGIGTTAPDSLLEINGRVSIRGGNELYFGQSTSAIGSWTTRMYASGSTHKFNANEFIFNNEGYGSTEFMRITSAGNVGINTTSPSYKLQVQADGAGLYVSAASVSPFTQDIAVFRYGGNGNAVKIENQGGKAAIQARLDNGTAMDLSLNASGGNVGIGTTSPAGKLDVRAGNGGRILFGSYDANYYAAFEGGDQLNFYNGASNATAYINYNGPSAVLLGRNLYVEGNSSGGTSGTVRIDSVGNVGIGTTSPSYKLDVVGDARITSGSLGVGVAPNATDGRIDASNDIVAFSSSDLRLKENIKPIENALDKVKSLTGVEFDWKPELKHAHGYEGHDTGVIAQEVQDVMPTAIRTNDTGYLAVRYEKLIGLLIEANKELAARVEELESKLK